MDNDNRHNSNNNNNNYTDTRREYDRKNNCRYNRPDTIIKLYHPIPFPIKKHSPESIRMEVIVQDLVFIA